jgi:hypothetical protein
MRVGYKQGVNRHLFDSSNEALVRFRTQARKSDPLA